jgi:hypothetical protein
MTALLVACAVCDDTPRGKRYRAYGNGQSSAIERQGAQDEI